MKNFLPLTLLLVLLGSTLVAQILPPLSMHPNTNHQVVVSWPYTNSGFVLQEATNLKTASWPSSAFSVAFNSNNSTFSVSAATTNATDFFRLSQPTDLRGLYVIAQLSDLPGGPNSAPVANALQVQGVGGILLVGMWSDIETNFNQYDWSHLDKWMNFAAGQNIKVDLAIRTGDGAPSWLYQQPPNGPGATELVFTISPKDGKRGVCEPDIVPVPWESAFLNSWNTFLASLSTHLKTDGTYSNITLLRLTGVNRTTDELRLPAETPDNNPYTGTGLLCVSNAPAIWQSNGYTPSKLLFAWSNVVSSFNASFPDKTFSVAIIPYPPQVPFPPIDDNTNLITTNLPDQNAPLLQLAGQMLPGRLVVQFNFLISSNTPNPAVPAAASNYGTLTAFQANNWLGPSNNIGCSACGGVVTNPLPCTDATYLQLLQQGIYPLGTTNSLRSQYIEVWATNANAFTNAVWQAYQQLLVRP
ncbi:MAG TPA: beta-galactosidase [Candidatus Acidoferrum sp.]|jgi:hypothetical protein|nr:beta-galactosidase [Candidatus Acidoferrum sp.]